MSQEAQKELIARLIPQLVKNLTGLKEAKSLHRCEQQAWTIIRNYRSTSIDCHNVRRQLDGLKEKFVIDNLKDYADHLERLCSEVINHPICLEHYEVDVQWSLVDFLLNVAYNPTGALRRNRHKIILSNPEIEIQNTAAQKEEMLLKNLLKEDFIPHGDYSETSDLSDWSDTESIDEKSSTTIQSEAISNQNETFSPSKSTFLLPNLPALKPPSKEIPYKAKAENPSLKETMRNSVQSTWWLQENNVHEVESNRIQSNFALLLSDFCKRSQQFEIFQNPSTISEFCLLRELVWMFHSPQKCKFFYVMSGKTKLSENITIPSISVPSLTNFLEDNILLHVDQMHDLRSFLTEVNMCQDNQLPKTYEYYAAILQNLIDPIMDEIISIEDCIARQPDSKINTLITFQSTLRIPLRQLNMLHGIHKAVTLDFRKYPAHISSAFLLAALMQFNKAATISRESHLAIALFLTSVKAFCDIIDTWWNEGRLDDWKAEFLVECYSDSSIVIRLYSKNPKRAFFVPKDISQTIEENKFLHLLMKHSMEAGHTLNLLYEISRIGDLRNDCKAIEGNLYDAFIFEVLKQIRELRNEIKPKKEPTQDTVDNISKEAARDNNHKSQLTTTDEFLLMLFNLDNKNESANQDCRDSAGHSMENFSKNSMEIYRELEKSTQILPLEEIILEAFSRILQERIALANMFVVKLYREDIEILKHLRNIRKVLLLEASDMMQHFYSKLFKQMETGQPWANAFVLTMQLDDIMSSKYPEMSSLFRIEINSAAQAQINKVIEAVKALTVGYNFSNELTKIISQDDMNTYNEIFRFLLKVKWGLATLENLKFVRPRRRPPYAAVEMADFLMRRLEQLRFWMLYGVQCVHSHLMMHVLQSMGAQLDEKIFQCTNVKQMESVHSSYLATASEHCFLKSNLSNIRIGIEQLLNLVFVLRSEWLSCQKYIQQCNPLAIDVSEASDDLEFEDYAITGEIDQIELTYIRCHQYLANMLNNEVYLNQNAFLSGLSAAFNTSLPC